MSNFTSTIAIALFTLLTATVGCATDPEPDGPPTKIDRQSDIAVDRPQIEESFELGSPSDEGPKVGDDRVVWAEVIEVNNSRVTRLHYLDVETRIETIEILDDDGVVQR